MGIVAAAIVGSVPAAGGPARLYLHGHALPDGVTFEQFVGGHDSGSIKAGESKFISSEPARLNGLSAHRWVSVPAPPGGRR